MKFIELFAGIGGFRYGLEAVNRTQNGGGEKIKKTWDSKGHEEVKSINAERRQFGEYNNYGRFEKQFNCVYANEFNKYAAQIYKERFKDEVDQRDIRGVGAEEIPDHDLLTAGFPCQSFSIAGKRGGFEDTRGTLFFEVARIAKQKQPRLLLLENVKGLLSHDKGKTFGTILNTLDELGYDCQWQVLNSKDFGVPQNRERVFIIGHLRGTSRPEIFPIGGTMQTNMASTAVDANYWKGIDNHGARTGISYSQEEWDKSDNTNGIRRTSYTDGMRIRRLTPTECERLQGFPDGWTEYGTEGKISDTQRYKCLGNAVTTSVITELGYKFRRKQ